MGSGNHQPDQAGTAIDGPTSNIPRRPPNRRDKITPLLLWWFIFVSVLASALPAGATEGEQPEHTPIEHTPIYSVTAGKSVPVNATFENPGEVAEIRLYFKTMAEDYYLFLPMAETVGGTYTAHLPPARNWTKGIDYLLLRKSLTGEIRKSKPFRLLVMNDFASPPPSAGEIQVQTEDPSAEAQNQDFAVPLRISVTVDPLFAGATEDPYPPISVPGPGGSSGLFGGLGGVSFSIKVRGVSFRYGSFSGR